LRDAIANQKKIDIVYQSQDGKKSHQTIWPFTIGYFANGRILVAWCEKHEDYRHFKTTGIISLNVLDERYPRSKEGLFREWQTVQLSKHSMNNKNDVNEMQNY